MIEEISRRLNFKPKYHAAKNWGLMLRNGTWKRGVIREIIDGKAEIIIGNMPQTKLLSYTMDFGPTLNIVRLIHFKLL